LEGGQGSPLLKQKESLERGLSHVLGERGVEDGCGQDPTKQGKREINHKKGATKETEGNLDAPLLRGRRASERIVQCQTDLYIRGSVWRSKRNAAEETSIPEDNGAHNHVWISGKEGLSRRVILQKHTPARNAAMGETRTRKREHWAERENSEAGSSGPG